MVAQPVAGFFNLDCAGMVEQSVNRRRCRDGIAEDVTQFGKFPGRSWNHRAFFVPGIDQLEGQVAAAGDRQVADLANNEQQYLGKETDLLGQATFRLGHWKRIS